MQILHHRRLARADGRRVVLVGQVEFRSWLEPGERRDIRMRVMLHLRERLDVGSGAVAGDGAVLETGDQPDVDIADDALTGSRAPLRKERAMRESRQRRDGWRGRRLEVDEDVLVR